MFSDPVRKFIDNSRPGIAMISKQDASVIIPENKLSFKREKVLPKAPLIMGEQTVICNPKLCGSNFKLILVC